MNPDDVERRFRELEQRVVAAEVAVSRVAGPFGRVLLAKRVEGSPRQWREWTVNNGTVAEFVTGRRCTNNTASGALPEENEPGLISLLEVEDAGAFRYIPIGGGGGVVVVDLEQTGGAGAPATWLYTAFAEGGDEVLGTLLSPLWRQLPIAMTAAVKGLGDYGGANGAFRLLIAFEDADAGGCGGG